MSYLVLARKWRPQRFDDIVGQAHITRVLQNAIRLGRIAHAYLFTGVRGVGKTTAARILAKALNCEKGPTPEPCNECPECSGIMGANSIDVYEIDGASNTGIDNVREIIENARYQPAKSRFKIYIIDEVHQISKAAFNALLKTLEEPPPFVKFILATTEAYKIPDTVLSRCQRFDFRRISVREICQRLRVIADKEQLSITDGALLLLAREAEGSMRDAQSLLEQVLSYSVPGSAETGAGGPIDEDLLQGLLGIAERKTLYDLSASVLAGDANRCVELVAELADQGRDLPRFSRDLVEHFRNLLVVRLIQDRGRESEDRGLRSSVPSRLLDLADREIEDLHRQAAELSVETLMDYFSFMAEADEEVARSAYPRFALEAAVVRLAKLPKTMPVTAVLERLEVLERKLSKESPAILRPRPPEPAYPPSIRQRKMVLEDEGPPAPQVSAAPPSEPTAGGDEKAEVWKRFVAFVMREKKALGSYLERVVPLEVSPSHLKLGAEDRLNYLQDPESLSLLKEFARRFFTAEIAVSVVPVSGKKPAPVAGPAAARGEPGVGVQDVLGVFGGSIVKKEG
ncbi:MAG: DNA polymerase III subunit gamma/tau [Deltaproteobacteria bacterium]|nr:DNA polymerase III subunit gamma/tau [Deltaproteobacteria bacterium]